MIDDVAVVVLSCGKPPYSQCWDPCAALLARFWPDRPWPLVLATDRFRGEVHGYDRIVESGAPLGAWGRHVSATMRILKERRVLLLLEDYWASATWNTAELKQCVKRMEASGAWYFRVAPTPGPDLPLTRSKDYGIHTLNERYRCSLQPAIWEREYLERLARPIADPWSFELDQNGEERALHLSVCVHNRPISYANAIHRGDWQEEALELARREGVTVPA